MSGLEALFVPLLAASPEVAIPAAVSAGTDIAMGGLGIGAAAAPVMTATAGASFPWLSVISAGGLLLSGISSRLSSASQANAEAKAIAQQAKLKEAQGIQRDQAIIAKGRATGAASGVDISSGTPLSVMIDNITQMEQNARVTRQTGQLQSSVRSAEANAYYGQIPGVIGDVLTSPSGSLLSKWAMNRFGYA